MNSQQIRENFLKFKNLITNDRNFTAAKQTLDSLMMHLSSVIHLKDHESKNILFFIAFLPSEGDILSYAEKLIEGGLDPLQKDMNKQTIVHYLAKQQKILPLKKFLTYNYNLNQNDYFNQTPLFYAAKHNQTTEIAELLIKYGCDVNHKDNNGQTCLYYAAKSGNLEMCKLFVSRDKSREKALNYAKKSQHHHIVDYLGQFKSEGPNNKGSSLQEKLKVSNFQQQSSQNQVANNAKDRRKRDRETVKNQCCLTYTNEKGEIHVLTLQELGQFKEVNEEYRKLYEALRNPDEPFESTLPIQDKKFEKSASKILTYFWKQENAYYFFDPVNYLALGLLDYPKIIKYPMDFGTIKTKLSFNAYENEAEFQEDMNLVFDNCILYNGTNKEIGRIALQMKMEFNTAFLKQFCV